MTKVYAGIDVSKSTLSVAFDGRVQDWKNTPSATARLATKLAKTPNIHAVCEATGGFETTLSDACHAAGVPITIAMPNRVRKFAQSHGCLAKTDHLDAGMIRAYGEAIKPAATTPRTPEQKKLLALIKRRSQVIEQHEVARAQLPPAIIPQARKEAERSVARLEKELAILEGLLAEIAATDAFKPAVKKLTSVIGVGPITALSALAYMPELGTINRREVAALAGLAPYNRDSGGYSGSRHIYGGRAAMRKVLYMSARSARVHNPELHRRYEELRARGKAIKVATVAIMRQIIMILNSIMREHLESASKSTQPTLDT